MKNKKMRFIALFLASVMILSLAACRSARSMNNGSVPADSSEPDWFNEEGTTTVIGNANGGGKSNTNTGKSLKDNTANVVKSEDFPWPNLKFNGNTVTLLSIDVSEAKSALKERQILKKQYGLEVKFVSASYFQLETKLLQMHAAGNAPDLCYYKWPSHEYLGMALKGMLRDVGEFVNLKDKALWGDLTTAYAQSKYSGHNYMAITGMSRGPYVLYNKKIFRDMGVDDLWETYKANPNAWDWNKLKEIGQATTDKNSNIVGLVTDDCGAFWHTTGQLYGEWGATRAATKVNMKNQAFARAAEFITQGRTDKWLNTAVQNTIEVFVNDAAAMAFAYTDIEDAVAAIAKRGDLGIVPIPKDPQAKTRWNYKHLYGYCMPTNSKNPNGGLAFILASRYHRITDDGLEDEEKAYRNLGLTDLNIQQLFEPDKNGSPIIDPASDLGYTNVWNCVLHEHPWSSTFAGETQDVTNSYIDRVFAGVE